MGLESTFNGRKEGVTTPAPGEPVSFSGPCPFCGKMITQTEVDPCAVRVTTRPGKAQTWSCHAACFKGAMAPSPFLDVSPLHF